MEHQEKHEQQLKEHIVKHEKTLEKKTLEHTTQLMEHQEKHEQQLKEHIVKHETILSLSTDSYQKELEKKTLEIHATLHSKHQKHMLEKKQENETLKRTLIDDLNAQLTVKEKELNVQLATIRHDIQLEMKSDFDLDIKNMKQMLNQSKQHEIDQIIQNKQLENENV